MAHSEQKEIFSNWNNILQIMENLKKRGKFLYEHNPEKTRFLFDQAFLLKMNVENLVYVIAPPPKNEDILNIHIIVGLVDKFSGDYLIPLAECSSCGISENARFGKKDNFNYVYCEDCKNFCFICILQSPNCDYIKSFLKEKHYDKPTSQMQTDQRSDKRGVRKFLHKIFGSL